MCRTKKIHMKQFKGTSSSHDFLRGVLGYGHLSRLTSTAKVILDEFYALNANDVLLLDECAQILRASMSKSLMLEPTL